MPVHWVSDVYDLPGHVHQRPNEQAYFLLIDFDDFGINQISCSDCAKYYIT